MSSHRAFFGRRRASDEMAIQITSMADIFMILLVFLLKSYSTSSISVDLSPNFKLPSATKSDDQIEAIKVAITETSVQIENQPVVQLTSFRFNPKDIKENGSAHALIAMLETQKKKQALIAQVNADVKMDPRMLIVADERTPYTTLKTILASAALSGYSDFKFVVARKE